MAYGIRLARLPLAVKEGASQFIVFARAETVAEKEQLELR